MTTITVLDPVTDILDTDLVMVTNAQGRSYTIAGSELNKRNNIIIAENTTVTGAPLKAGRCVRIYFSVDITANDGNTVMQINYNGVNYYVKTPKDGALSNFVAHAVGNTYKYVQAHTTLEFLVVGNQQDGFQFVIIGNPVVISNSDYSIQADGLITYQNIMLCQKIDMPIFSKTDARYVKVVFDFSTNKWEGAKLWLRVRYDNLQAILYENDNVLYMQKVFLNSVGFFTGLKYSINEHTFFFTIPNYAGAPVLYFEKTKEDNIGYVSYEVSSTPFAYPSDTTDI